MGAAAMFCRVSDMELMVLLDCTNLSTVSSKLRSASKERQLLEES